MVKYCTECGVKNDDSARYCNQCAHPFGEAPYPASYVAVNSKKKKKDEYKVVKILGVVGIILFMPLAVGAGIYLITRDDKSARNAGIALTSIGIIWIVAVVLFFKFVR
jgi:uncharacterized membrane protein YvbJ